MKHKVAIVLNHQLTEEQLKELSGKYRKIVYLPDELKAKFAQVEPKSTKETAKAIVDWLKKEHPDAVVIQGNPDVAAMILLWCALEVVEAFYASEKSRFTKYVFSEVFREWMIRFAFKGDRTASPLK